MAETGAHLTEHLEPPALRALIEAMYLAAYADQEFSDEERKQFSGSLAQLTRERVDEALLEDILADLTERLGRDGREACLQDIAARLTTDELRTAALVLASDMAAADGVIKPEELELLRKLAEALELEEALVKEALDGLTG